MLIGSLLSSALKNNIITTISKNYRKQLEHIDFGLTSFLYNMEFVEVTGYAPGEVIGQNLRILPSKTHLSERFYKDFWERILSGNIWKGDVVNQKKHGEDFWESASISPIMNDAGDITHFVAVAEDITDRKRMEEELVQAKRAADQANTAKSAFLATMSHEIRTPMNAIINMTGLALDTDLTSKQHQYLTVVNASARGLLALINDILDFSKIEAGRMELEAAPFHLRQVLEEITDAFRGRVLEKKLEFVVHIGVEVPDHLIGDTLRLRQVVINLVGNAFKFTDHGEVVLRVALAEPEPAADAGQHGTVRLRFAVHDTGIGIPKDRQDNLFEAFEQVDRSTSRQYGGTGLGLAICRRLVALMGGNLQVESEAGRGSEFFFTARFDVASEAVRDLSVPAVIQDLRVLVIDDNASARELLATLLDQFGMHCALTESAEAGLALLQQHNVGRDRAVPFGLVILDWLLPGLDGLEAARQIRTQQATADLPIMLISAFAGAEEEAQARRLGVNAFLPKPITASSLFDAIMDVLHVPHPQKPRHTPREFDAQEFAGRKVLLAEDNEANQFVAEELLSRAGIVLDIAENGRIALEKVRRQDYDAILMDMQMPEMDGLEATRRVRAEFPDRHLPIIALTANAMRGDLESCLEAGMDDYVSKPIDRQQLFLTLRKWLPSTLVAPAARPATPAVVAPAPETPAELPELPGLDVAGALQRLGLSYATYEKLLFRFADGQPHTLAALRAALDDGDWETARRHAHSLAGAAGNVSANDLRTPAKQLELALKDRAGGYDPLYRDLQAEAERVFAGISACRATTTSPAATPAAAAADTPVDLARLVPALEELEARLSEGDADGVTAALESACTLGLADALHVVAFLNRYFETMVEVIFTYQGTIDEIIGDALLVLFGAPMRHEDDAQRAVACAVAMQLAMEEVKAQNRREGLPEVDMGIGIHTGVVVVGNIGSSKRTKYGAVGSNINLTGRIESFTTGGQILISEPTRQEVGPILRIAGQMDVSPKGAQERVTLYDLRGIGDPYNLSLPEPHDSLVPLETPAALRYAVLEDKHVGSTLVTGHLVKLSVKGAEIHSDTPVSAWSNVKIWLTDKSGADLPGDLYAKVVGHPTERATGFTVRFTSLAPEVRTFVQELLGSQP
ncbi:MAG: response regulator [Planctomycetota bacterium]|jgi:PAS domain S-box-containing protein